MLALSVVLSLLALPFRVEILRCTLKWAKVWYPYILGSGGVHYRNIMGIIKGHSWALPCYSLCVSNLVY